LKCGGVLFGSGVVNNPGQLECRLRFAEHGMVVEAGADGMLALPRPAAFSA
jgi:hypothetical protein